MDINPAFTNEGRSGRLSRLINLSVLTMVAVTREVEEGGAGALAALQNYISNSFTCNWRADAMGQF